MDEEVESNQEIHHINGDGPFVNYSDDRKLTKLTERLDSFRNMLLADMGERERNLVPSRYAETFAADWRVTKEIFNKRTMRTPLDFQRITTIFDDKICHKGIFAYNRTSRILDALSTAVFNSKNHTAKLKTMFLEQFETEIQTAKQSLLDRDINTCERLVNMIITDGPWTDDEWIITSKVLLSPIHVHVRCSRVPFNPHVRRYVYSPCMETQLPLRIVVETKEFECPVPPSPKK